MQHEIDAISTPKAATRFAFGCLFAAIGQRLSFSAKGVVTYLTDHPKLGVALCAILATGLGLVYMAFANAPTKYLIVNACALAFGFIIVGIATMIGRHSGPVGGPISLMLSSSVMLTSLYGISAEGATRWIWLAGSSVQTSLLIVPIVAMIFARQQSGLTTLAVVVTSLALALQPDRAMAGALAAGMLALALSKLSLHRALAACAAIFGFTAALMQPDTLPATPYVDQVFFSSFGVHPVAGFSVLLGAMLMVGPAILGYLGGGPNKPIFLVFGAVWSAIGLAAALGNYPTPIVGYGSSAIIGYVICMLGFTRPAQQRKKTSTVAPKAVDRSAPNRDLRALLPLYRSV